MRKLRGGGPDEDLESWYDGAIDEAASIISGAIPNAAPPPATMYWTRSLKRSDLVQGNVFAHGSTRLNLSAGDLSTFVDPADAALMFGFRALDSGGTFESSFAVWMATLRRRGGQDAIIESLQRIFTQLVDEESLRLLLVDTAAHARSLGYEKVWLVPGLLNEPLFAAAVKATADHLGHPMLVVPTSGMAALVL